MTDVRSLAEAETHIASLRARVLEIERRVRHVEKQLDTHGSPLWKRAWFRLQGWPPWWVVAERPQPLWRRK